MVLNACGVNFGLANGTGKWKLLRLDGSECRIAASSGAERVVRYWETAVFVLKGRPSSLGDFLGRMCPVAVVGYSARRFMMAFATWCVGWVLGVWALLWMSLRRDCLRALRTDLLASLHPYTGRLSVPLGRREKGGRGKGSVVPVIMSANVAADCIALIQKVSCFRPKCIA